MAAERAHSETRQRTELALARCTPEEKTRIGETAAAAGVSESALLRESALGRRDDHDCAGHECCASMERARLRAIAASPEFAARLERLPAPVATGDLIADLLAEKLFPEES